MMRDENEGFAKLAVEISEASKEDDASEARLHNIVSLIGYFDLDPDRVVDLVIESWLTAPMKASHLGILKKFKHTSVAHFLGKRFELLLNSTGNAS
jgi:THO complex subunit 2